MAMSMNRAIHSAVRRDLHRFETALDAFRPGDRHRATQLATAWAYFADQLHRHHHGEHAIAWPALTSLGVSADLIGAMDAEHEAMAAAVADAGASMSALTRTQDEATLDGARTAFARLREVTVTHLDHEEAQTEPVYLAHHDSPEIKAMSRAFRREGASQGGRLFVWVLDGAGPEERATVSNGTPRPVLAAIAGIFGRDDRRNVAPVWGV